jgi:hypothetical protein
MPHFALENHEMQTLTFESLLLFVCASLLGMVFLSEWASALMVFAGQAVISFCVWLSRLAVRVWLRKRRLSGADSDSNSDSNSQDSGL